MKTLHNTDIDHYVEIYNSQGKDAAIEYVTQECQTNYLAFQQRMRKSSNYVYDRRTRKFAIKTNEETFLSLEELCVPKNGPAKRGSDVILKSEKANYDEIIVGLMKDRLTEFAKYIHFEQSAKKIHIDTDRLKHDGYTLTMS